MRKQQRSRRWVLRFLSAVAAAPAVVDSGGGASARVRTTRPRPDFPSRAAFRAECAALGGMFIDDGKTIRCQHQDGTVVECDLEGSQCTVTNRGGRPGKGAKLPGRGANSPDGTGTHNTGDGGRGLPGLPGRPQQDQPDTLPTRSGAND